MKSTITFTILATLLVIASVAGVIAPQPECTGNPGAIWTTNNDCGNETQDENQYALGGTVYINGKNFCAGTYDWSITKQSGNPKIVVASGNKTVDSTGSFCFKAYTIQANDTGVYSVDFGNKNDNYRVDLSLPVVPEFSTYVGALTVLGAVGLFFLVRKN